MAEVGVVAILQIAMQCGDGHVDLREGGRMMRCFVDTCIWYVLVRYIYHIHTYTIIHSILIISIHIHSIHLPALADRHTPHTAAAGYRQV